MKKLIMGLLVFGSFSILANADCFVETHFSTLNNPAVEKQINSAAGIFQKATMEGNTDLANKAEMKIESIHKNAVELAIAACEEL